MQAREQEKITIKVFFHYTDVIKSCPIWAKKSSLISSVSNEDKSRIKKPFINPLSRDILASQATTLTLFSNVQYTKGCDKLHFQLKIKPMTHFFLYLFHTTIPFQRQISFLFETKVKGPLAATTSAKFWLFAKKPSVSQAFLFCTFGLLKKNKFGIFYCDSVRKFQKSFSDFF